MCVPTIMKESFKINEPQSQHQQPRVIGNTVLKEEFVEEVIDEKKKEFTKPDLTLVPRANKNTEGVDLTESNIEEFNRAMEIFQAEQERKRALTKPKDVPKDEEINIFDIEDTRRMQTRNVFQKTVMGSQDLHHDDMHSEDGRDGVPLPRSTEQASLPERLIALEKKFAETDDSLEKSNLTVEIREIKNELEEDLKRKILVETEKLEKLQGENGDEHHEVIQARKKIEAYKKIYESIKNPR